MIKRNVKMAVFGALGLILAGAANASPLITLPTSVQGSDGNAYSYIGTPFQTTGASFAIANGIDTLTFTTAFNGEDSVNGYEIGYASVFVGNMAISLGGEGMNGGVGAGLYQTGSYLTSQNIWSQRSGIKYGLGYNLNGHTYAAPTVLTGGNFVEGISVVSNPLTNGFYAMSISFLDNAAFDKQLADNGLFWGTGDCANGAVVATIPEPSAILLFLASLSILGLITKIPKTRNQL